MRGVSLCYTPMQDMTIDIDKNPETMWTAVFWLWGMAVVTRLVAWVRFHLRYKYADSLRQMLCRRVD